MEAAAKAGFHTMKAMEITEKAWKKETPLSDLSTSLYLRSPRSEPPGCLRKCKVQNVRCRWSILIPQEKESSERAELPHHDSLQCVHTSPSRADSTHSALKLTLTGDIFTRLRQGSPEDKKLMTLRQALFYTHRCSMWRNRAAICQSIVVFPHMLQTPVMLKNHSYLMYLKG